MTPLKFECLSFDLLMVKFVEDILDFAIWRTIFTHILYLIQKNQ